MQGIAEHGIGLVPFSESLKNRLDKDAQYFYFDQCTNNLEPGVIQCTEGFDEIKFRADFDLLCLDLDSCELELYKYVSNSVTCPYNQLNRVFVQYSC